MWTGAAAGCSCLFRIPASLAETYYQRQKRRCRNSLNATFIIAAGWVSVR